MTQATPANRKVDPGALWAGGLAAAVVAALIAVVGIVICRGILDIPVLAPKGDGVWGGANTATYAGGAAVAALVATGVMHLLLLSTPRPSTFFGWIMALTTLTAALLPFAVKASTESRVATAIINLLLGIAIGSLVATSARSAVRKAAFRTGPALASPYYPPR